MNEESIDAVVVRVMERHDGPLDECSDDLVRLAREVERQRGLIDEIDTLNARQESIIERLRAVARRAGGRDDSPVWHALADLQPGDLNE